jgi:hypothetical protein
MRRSTAVWGHVLLLVVAAALYVFFVLPRWYELTGHISHPLGTAMRILTGVLIGLNALPVLLTLVRTVRPELGTPVLAVRMRQSSIVLHVLAGVLIAGAAIAEIWLTLDRAGQWLWGCYGAAAALTVLGALAYYLSFVAELPPPPPKARKPKPEKTRRRGRRMSTNETSSGEDETTTGPEEPEAGEEPQADEDHAVVEEAAAQR